MDGIGKLLGVLSEENWKRALTTGLSLGFTSLNGFGFSGPAADEVLKGPALSALIKDIAPEAYDKQDDPGMQALKKSLTENFNKDPALATRLNAELAKDPAFAAQVRTMAIENPGILAGRIDKIAADPDNMKALALGQPPAPATTAPEPATVAVKPAEPAPVPPPASPKAAEASPPPPREKTEARPSALAAAAAATPPAAEKPATQDPNLDGLISMLQDPEAHKLMARAKEDPEVGAMLKTMTGFDISDFSKGKDGKIDPSAITNLPPDKVNQLNKFIAKYEEDPTILAKANQMLSSGLGRTMIGFAAKMPPGTAETIMEQMQHFQAKMEGGMNMFKGIGDMLSDGKLMGALASIPFIGPMIAAIAPIMGQVMEKMEGLVDKFKNSEQFQVISNNGGTLAATMTGNLNPGAQVDLEKSGQAPEVSARTAPKPVANMEEPKPAVT